jgi:hypothetical protein
MSNFLTLEEQMPQGTTPQGDGSIGPFSDPEWAVRVKRGANWFYWIAGLSVINSIAFISGANFHFVIGLGVTEVANALAQAMKGEGAAMVMKVFAIIFDLVAIIGFALTGYFANKPFQAAFIVGIIVYVIDGLIVLAFGDFLMAAFHAFALYGIIRGFLACREMKAFEKANAAAAITPPPPPAFG